MIFRNTSSFLRLSMVVLQWFPYFFTAHFLRMRHEASGFHRAAVEVERDAAPLVALPKCSGINLSGDESKNSLMAAADFQNMLRIWIEAGCIGVMGSLTESVVAKLQGEDIVIYDSLCHQDPCFARRGHTSCQRCENVINKTKLVSCISEWAMKIKSVDLAHLLLQGDRKKQQEIAEVMENMWPELRCEELGAISYSAMIAKCRLMFMRVPLSKQNLALKNFIGRSIRYLTPTVMAGVDPAIKQKVLTYVDALGSGSLDHRESSAVDPCLTSPPSLGVWICLDVIIGLYLVFCDDASCRFGYISRGSMFSFLFEEGINMCLNVDKVFCFAHIISISFT